MRTALKRIGSENRHLFLGSFVKYGCKPNHSGSRQTVLLKEIKDENNKYLCDHLWFNKTKGFSKLDLHWGDIVSFYGRVEPYMRGYMGNKDIDKPMELDYEIMYPTQVKLIERYNGKALKKYYRQKVRYRYSHSFSKK